VLAARERVAAEDTDAVRAGYESFFEELVVRRELAANFTQFNDRYDHYEGLPDWARKTLEEHISDPRPATYSPDQLEAGETEDKYWNACQREMVVRGKMHGYMRMYWGKKILEWMNDPAEAMQLAISLNDKYELDGRDPNGYAGVAWCFGKHDRAWPERPVYGKVRYMNANGLKRKFKQIEQYVERWQATD
jgi:deoxyribodipyrimidine photo-lyase